MTNVRGSTRNDNKHLTDKLIEYLHYVGQGFSDNEIAEKLNASRHTTHNRLNRVMDITGCLTREEVVAYAKEHVK
jgi:DNA-binding CsgD family transcriptional regulator